MTSSARYSDRWIPRYFFIFFAVIFIVDAAMVTVAIKTQTGTVTEHPYEKGLAYNNVVLASEAQQATGWKGEIGFHEGTILFQLRDVSGRTILPDSVAAVFTRPTQAGMDFREVLQKSGEGYTVTPRFPAAGLWEVRIHALWQGKAYQQSKRIVVQ